MDVANTQAKHLSQRKKEKLEKEYQNLVHSLSLFASMAEWFKLSNGSSRFDSCWMDFANKNLSFSSTPI